MPLTWTKDVPTVPGWYWCQWSDGRATCEEVVEGLVNDEDDEKQLVIPFEDDFVVLGYDSLISQWAGPIPLPAELLFAGPIPEPSEPAPAGLSEIYYALEGC